MREQHGKKRKTSLDSGHTYYEGREEDRITIWENNDLKHYEVPNFKIIDYISKILSHPRSKETISYLEEEIEREFPGIMNYIKRNFDVYNKITGLTYEKDQEFEELINGIIIPECNFKAKKNKSIKRIKRQEK